MSTASKKPHLVYAHDRAAAPEATTNGWVRDVYRDALEYTTSDKSVRGVTFLMGGDSQHSEQFLGARSS